MLIRPSKLLSLISNNQARAKGSFRKSVSFTQTIARQSVTNLQTLLESSARRAQFHFELTVLSAAVSK